MGCGAGGGGKGWGLGKGGEGRDKGIKEMEARGERVYFLSLLHFYIIYSIVLVNAKLLTLSRIYIEKFPFLFIL